MKHFRGAFIFTFICLILAYLWAHKMHAGMELASLFIVLVLSILEISLSFDNAVINATKLEKMTPVWQHRFLTWGIFIAVFGMRFLFPVLIVAIFSRLSLGNVIDIALHDSNQYAHYLHIAHPPIVTFGGAFLIMLFFTYFFNHEKELHWIKPIESKMSLLGHFRSIEVILTLIIIYISQHFIAAQSRHEAVIAGIFGIITYLLVNDLSELLERHAPKNDGCSSGFNLKNSCLINFIYLEIIDASFSLDGVLGAFALSKDILIITLGLSIGAMFVRSLTLLLVEKKTLHEYKYLEHGAHWAIGALAIIMFISSFKEVSEVITGLIGLIFILLAFFSSVIANKKEKAEE